jgi:2-dehydro-3-deoxyphosphogluconate aldolase/(4S)-4-hydroxy-2-oxoglutarate aldolase
MIGMLVKAYGNEMYIGAGTVLEERQVELTKEAGGRFIISPDVNARVIQRTRALEMVSMPGALTPSEITMATRYGADFVKLFPISNLGAGYVKAIKAPLSNIKLLAVGGIHDKNMEEYYKAGCVGFGIGSNITDKKMIENNDWTGIEELARKYVTVVQNLK